MDSMTHGLLAASVLGGSTQAMIGQLAPDLFVVVADGIQIARGTPASRAIESLHGRQAHGVVNWFLGAHKVAHSPLAPLLFLWAPTFALSYAVHLALDLVSHPGWRPGFHLIPLWVALGVVAWP